jgi:hypothetical protein
MKNFTEKWPKKWFSFKMKRKIYLQEKRRRNEKIVSSWEVNKLKTLAKTWGKLEFSFLLRKIQEFFPLLQENIRRES